MEPLIRIRTKVGVGKVFTLYFRNEWVTIMSGVGSSKSTAAQTLIEASDNHLNFCKLLKEKQNVQGGSNNPKLSDRTVHTAHDSRGVYDRHDRAHRKGTDGNGGEGWESLLPTNDASSGNEEAIQLESQNQELKKKEEKTNE